MVHWLLENHSLWWYQYCHCQRRPVWLSQRPGSMSVTVSGCGEGGTMWWQCRLSAWQRPHNTGTWHCHCLLTVSLWADSTSYTRWKNPTMSNSFPYNTDGGYSYYNPQFFLNTLVFQITRGYRECPWFATKNQQHEARAMGELCFYRLYAYIPLHLQLFL